MNKIVFEDARGNVFNLSIPADASDAMIEAARDYLLTIGTKLENDRRTGFPSFDIYGPLGDWIAGG